MQRQWNLIAIFFITAFAASAFPVTVRACGGGSREMNPEVLVRNSEVIVRATAVGYADPPPDGSWIRFIEFRVTERLKGEKVPNALLIRGFLTNEDDYNDHPVPYNLVRPMGRHGSCSARHYKLGAEFLLFLKWHDPNEEYSREWGDVTPYWASMAATNEQLHSVNDAWLLWVRENLRKISGGRKEGNYFSPFIRWPHFNGRLQLRLDQP